MHSISLTLYLGVGVTIFSKSTWFSKKCHLGVFPLFPAGGQWAALTSTGRGSKRNFLKNSFLELWHMITALPEKCTDKQVRQVLYRNVSVVHNHKAPWLWHMQKEIKPRKQIISQKITRTSKSKGSSWNGWGPPPPHTHTQKAEKIVNGKGVGEKNLSCCVKPSPKEKNWMSVPPPPPTWPNNSWLGC